jgi:hypothetical protein
MIEPNEIAPHLDRARQHAAVGTIVAPGARFRLAKQLLLRAAHLITAEQVEFNRAVLAALNALSDSVRALESSVRATESEVRDLKRVTLTLQASLATTDVRLQAIADAIGPDGETPAGSGPTAEDATPAR